MRKLTAAPLLDGRLTGRAVWRPGSGGHWRGYAFAVASVALLTAVIGAVMRWTPLPNSSSLYLVTVLAAAALYGSGPAVLAAVLSFFAYDYFFVEPVHVPTVRDPREWLYLLIFLLVALVTGQLAAALRRQAEAAGEREREAVALYEVVRDVPGSTLELHPLLGLILERLAALVEYRAAEIIALEGDQAVVLDYRGPLPWEQVVGFRLPPDSALRRLVDEVARRREPLIVDDLVGPSLLARDLAAAGASLPLGPDRTDRAGCELSVPLIVKGEVIGVQTLLHPTPGYYTERHARLAMAFAQQEAAAVENVRLYEAARGRAALEERQRLARELHDSVSQVLYAIALNASTAAAVQQAAPERLGGLLQEVVDLAEAGLAEMRALIFELRPESLAQEGLVAALEKQAAAARARHGLDVRAALGAEPAAPLPVKEALYRIAQEALHNTTKHARARTVDLTLETDGGDLVLCVADDGRGFDAGGSFPGHLGLRSMRERAAAVGGALEVESAPGQGTRVQARVPVTAAADALPRRALVPAEGPPG